MNTNTQLQNKSSSSTIELESIIKANRIISKEQNGNVADIRIENESSGNGANDKLRVVQNRNNEFVDSMIRQPEPSSTLAQTNAQTNADDEQSQSGTEALQDMTASTAARPDARQDGQINGYFNHSDLFSPSSNQCPVTSGRVILIHTCNNRSKVKGLESLFLTPSNSTGMGTVIDKNHSKFSFIYKMLTGIKICALKSSAPIELCPDDFTETNKIDFNLDANASPVNESTPHETHYFSHPIEPFQFKDYAPNAFALLRKYYGISTVEEYLLSLTNKYEMNEVKSPGKSGSFFYLSNGYHFIIKTIRKREAKFLLHILPRYFLHIKTHPTTLLSRYCGLHRVTVRKGKMKYFVVMINIFPPGRPLQEVYDLKGATFGRRSEQKEIQNFLVMKDLNLLENVRHMEVNRRERDFLLGQLQDDVSFLVLIEVMDYSLLLGIAEKSDTSTDNLPGKSKDEMNIIRP